MSDPDTLVVDPSNVEQARAWDGAEGDYWAEHADRFDRSMAGYQPAFLDAAADRPRRPGAGRRLRHRAEHPGRRPAGRPRAARSGVDLSAAHDRRGPAAGRRARRCPTRGSSGPTRRSTRSGPARFDIGDQPDRGDVLRRPAGRVRQHRPGAAPRRPADPAHLAAGRAQRVVRRVLDRADRPRRAARAAAGRARPVLARATPTGCARCCARPGSPTSRSPAGTAPLHYGPGPRGRRSGSCSACSAGCCATGDDPDRGRAALRASLTDHLGPDGVRYGSAAWLVTAHRHDRGHP